MKKRFAAIVLVVLEALAFTTPASASAVFGAPTCGDWIKTPSQAKKSWLWGFMSGLNLLNDYLDRTPKDPLDQLDSAQQMNLWMDNYCQANPLETVSRGGAILYEELRSRARR